MGPVHRVAMDALREYMIVGGMPQTVRRHFEGGDFKAVDREKRKILALYRKGIREHAGGLAERVEALYDFISSELQKHEKKVVLSEIEPEAGMRDYLLAKSKLAKKNNIRPVEVKSGKNTTHRSLDKLRSKYADWLDSPCLLWDKDLKVEGDITYLPLYMASLL